MEAEKTRSRNRMRSVSRFRFRSSKHFFAPVAVRRREPRPRAVERSTERPRASTRKERRRSNDALLSVIPRTLRNFNRFYRPRRQTNVKTTPLRRKDRKNRYFCSTKSLRPARFVSSLKKPRPSKAVVLARRRRSVRTRAFLFLILIFFVRFARKIFSF